MREAKYDTFYRRFFAKIIDYFLIILIIGLFALLIPKDTYQFNYNNLNSENPIIQNPNPISDFWAEYGNLISSLLLIIYYIIFNFFYGQTIGKMIVNVKIWDISETKKINFIQAILRNSPDIVFAIVTFFIVNQYIEIAIASLWILINLIQIFTNKKYRTLEDLIASTVVLVGKRNTILEESKSNQKFE